jgi:prepilin-type N-terminal cleavage/methylation domain-containing protein
MNQMNQRGFTLMELMVVIVIVAILAAVAVPLYINYVRDAQRTEARGAIAAIVTAEQVHLQRFGTYINATANDLQTWPTSTGIPPENRLDVDVREALANWAIDISGADANAFVATATGLGGVRPVPTDMQVIYNHNRTAPLPNPWEER